MEKDKATRRELKRRDFVKSAAIGAVTVGGLGSFLDATSAGQQESTRPTPKKKLKFGPHSRQLAFLSGVDLAKTAAEIGCDTIGLDVRSRGHVKPERAAEDMPPLVKLIRQEGVDVEMIITSISSPETPHAETVLRTASELGIHVYRSGGFRYNEAAYIPIWKPGESKVSLAGAVPILQQLDSFKPRVAELAALNAKYNMTAAYHTGSQQRTPGRVGSSVWDLFYLLKDFDPALVGVNYDVGHLTCESGGGAWANNLRLLGPYLRSIALQDFIWVRSDVGQWEVRWVPMGQGMVRFPQFAAVIGALNFSGPIYFEAQYPALAEAGRAAKTLTTISREQVYAALKRDIEYVRGVFKEADI
jgi:sugar phosphate isomerase/epimerase